MEPIILVKLKMRFFYKFLLGVVTILLMVMFTVGTLYFIRNKDSILASDIEVNGALSINYVDGKKFEVSGTERVKISVSNSSDEAGYYNICFTKIRGNGTYKILDNDILILEGDLTSTDEILTDYIKIEAKETKEYVIELTSLNEEVVKGNISIRNQIGKTETFADIILNNSQPSENSLSKVGSEIAVEDEGLIKSTDDIGVTYYFRGNVQNNYVEFGNLLWRIVRINGDGTVRLVLDGVAETLGNYVNTDKTDYEFEKSALNDYLDLWLDNNLINEKKYIASTGFCSDLSQDETGNYLAKTRIITNQIPTFNCLGTTVNNNIGLLTIDEVILAGANYNQINQKFYLYNSEITDTWYTMTAAEAGTNSINMFMVNANGSIRTDINANLYRNIRPVINLIKNIKVSGNGTKSDPYKIIV